MVLTLAIVFTVFTIFQTQYNENLPYETTFSSFSGSDMNMENIYYLNGETELNDVAPINRLLFDKKLIKQSKFDSYKFIFCCSKSQFILAGTVIFSGMPTYLVLYEWDDYVYVVIYSVIQNKDVFDKDVFAVYRCEDSNLLAEILKYKADSQKYYVFGLPDWRYELLELSEISILVMFIVFLEVIICLKIFKQRDNITLRTVSVKTESEKK